MRQATMGCKNGRTQKLSHKAPRFKCKRCGIKARRKKQVCKPKEL